MKNNKLSYMLFCVFTHFYEGRQMYSLDKKRIHDLYKCLSNSKRFKDIYDMYLGRDLMYDLALKHTFEKYFSDYPEDEKNVLNHILFM